MTTIKITHFAALPVSAIAQRFPLAPFKSATLPECNVASLIHLVFDQLTQLESAIATDDQIVNFHSCKSKVICLVSSLVQETDDAPKKFMTGLPSVMVNSKNKFHSTVMRLGQRDCRIHILIAALLNRVQEWLSHSEQVDDKSVPSLNTIVEKFGMVSGENFYQLTTELYDLTKEIYAQIVIAFKRASAFQFAAPTQMSSVKKAPSVTFRAPSITLSAAPSVTRAQLPTKDSPDVTIDESAPLAESSSSPADQEDLIGFVRVQKKKTQKSKTIKSSSSSSSFSEDDDQSTETKSFKLNERFQTIHDFVCDKFEINCQTLGQANVLVLTKILVQELDEFVKKNKSPYKIKKLEGLVQFIYPIIAKTIASFDESSYDAISSSIRDDAAIHGDLSVSEGRLGINKIVLTLLERLESDQVGGVSDLLTRTGRGNYQVVDQVFRLVGELVGKPIYNKV